ncbi:transposase [Thermobifida halotolerans]|uniref:transposase n=1 Tax=Thermobifida halotolerans TaxID=483545 RepID=UPI000A68E469|nr:transposase [Thermobifida halotolerans]
MAGRPTCSTDLPDAEWELTAPLIPAPKPGGRPALHERHEIVNALAYGARSECAWRLPPHHLPPWQTVYHYWRQRRIEGRWERILLPLRQRERQKGQTPPPAQRGHHRLPEPAGHRPRRPARL